MGTSRMNTTCYQTSFETELSGALERIAVSCRPVRCRLTRKQAACASPSPAVCATWIRWRETLALVESMKSDDLSPDVYSYAGCIDACAKAAQWKKACQILGQMREAGVEVSGVGILVPFRACVCMPYHPRTLKLFKRVLSASPLGCLKWTSLPAFQLWLEFVHSVRIV